MDTKTSTDITPLAAYQRLREGALLIDVREPHEWEVSHVKGARLIPLGEFEARAAGLPRDRDILIICRSGRRSGIARDMLREQYGMRHAYNVAGGIIAWGEVGLPVVH